INDVWIGRCDGDRANGARALYVEEGMPCRSVVRGSPNAAIVEADVGDVRLAWYAGNSAGATGAAGPDRAPVHFRVEVRGLRAGDRREGNYAVESETAHGGPRVRCGIEYDTHLGAGKVGVLNEGLG